MKKEDLRNGMIIEIEWSALGNQRFIILDEFCIGFDGFFSKESIEDDLTISGGKIIKVFINKKMLTLKDIDCDFFLDLIWTRDNVINWGKVPEYTQVQVKDDEMDEWNNAYFREYSKNSCGYNFLVSYFEKNNFTNIDPGVEGWHMCRIHPNVSIEKEWYE